MLGDYTTSAFLIKSPSSDEFRVHNESFNKLINATTCIIKQTRPPILLFPAALIYILLCTGIFSYYSYSFKYVCIYVDNYYD